MKAWVACVKLYGVYSVRCLLRGSIGARIFSDWNVMVEKTHFSHDVFVLYFAKYSRYEYAVSEVHATLSLKPSPPAAHNSPQQTKAHTSYLLP